MTTAPTTTATTLVRRRPPPRVRRRRLVGLVATHAVLIAFALAFLLPFVFITLTALMTNEQALSSQLWPHPFRFRNFIDVFTTAPLLRWTFNTMVYSCLATLGVLVSSVPVAYALARVRWRGRNLAFLVVLVALMLPPQVTVVPLYVMWAKLHLVGTLWPVILPNWFGDAFSIFLLRQFFLTIPEEYLDAARVDGCGELRILFTVVTRLAKPGARGSRALLVPLHVQRLLPPAALRRRELPQLGPVDRARSVPLLPSGSVEPDDGRDAARDGAR